MKRPTTTAAPALRFQGPPVRCIEPGCQAEANLGDRVLRGAVAGSWRCDEHKAAEGRPS